jgi:hypothetical protein
MSKDILFISLAVAALVGTAFWVLLLAEVIKILRTVARTINEFHDRLRTIDDILQTIKDKITSTHIELIALAQGVKTLISFFANRKTGNRSSKRASATADDI